DHAPQTPGSLAPRTTNRRYGRHLRTERGTRGSTTPARGETHNRPSPDEAQYRPAPRDRADLHERPDVQGGLPRPRHLDRYGEVACACRPWQDEGLPVRLHPVMIHPPGDVLRAYAEGTTDLTRRLLVEAHLTLCRECSALVPHHRDPGHRLPEASAADLALT